MTEKIKTWYEAICSTDFGYVADRPFLYIGLAALVLLILWLLYRIRPRRRIRAFKGETGYVEISRHALLELVHSACEQMPEVRKPSIKIRARRKLNLSVRIRVDGTAMLRDTASYLQTHLKDSLENNLGVERLGKIEILVTGIRSGTRPKIDLNTRDEETSTPAPAPAPKAPAPTPVPAAPKPVSSPLPPEPTKKPEPQAPLKPGPVSDGSTPKPTTSEDPKEELSEDKDPKPDEKKSGPGFFEKKKK